ncbi:MAG: tetraacyldisaccharide 4'-kinase [Acidobacteria bacterium]|nr:tetraacyldisaccharide 4'-kinase [Acidobacteriota bacterium]
MTGIRERLESGMRPGGSPGPLARMLGPFVRIAEFGALVRGVAYETGYLSQVRLDRPVISVGNLTLGGTGKTPIVAHIVRVLRDQGYECAVLTRGYGRQSKERVVLGARDEPRATNDADRAGDEPAMLARELDGVPIVVDPDRAKAASWAALELGTEVFVLDDGFQHLQLARDLNLLVLDATDPFGCLRMPPVGRLREPLQGMKRADAVIVTRSDRPFDESAIERVVRGTCRPDIPIFHSWHDIDALRPVFGGELRDPQTLRGRKVGVLTAIGNPVLFTEDLRNIGMQVVSESAHRDHHPYSREDLAAAAASAISSGAEALLTTEKDAVKLERFDPVALPLYAVRIAFRSDDEGRILSLVLKAALRKS